ncbi:hypothetical protein LWI29_031359 [Acer saccharum]|uniref:Uncharacterized protein n=1 Tax=Acer saccharum TaxID=4024 RepID=A0AA39SPF4_ACESA|nr:hypothetical protein LWI29_031359 [Acer saccharum]
MRENTRKIGGDSGGDRAVGRSSSQTYGVQVIEEPTAVGYSEILDLLGLNWEDDDVDEMLDDHRKRKEDEGTEVMWTNHRKSDLLTGDRPRSNQCNDKKRRSGVETLVDNCLGKGTKTDGVDRSIKGKGIDKEKVSGKQSLFENRTAATYGVLDVGDKRNDGGFDSFDDSEEGYDRNYDICGGTSAGRLGQFDKLGHRKGGNIVIDLGKGLLVDNHGPNMSKLPLQDLDIGGVSNKAQLELTSDPRLEVAEEDSLSENSISHVSATQPTLTAERATFSAQVGIKKKMSTGNNKMTSKRHGMVTRKGRDGDLRAEGLSQEEEEANGRWNLEKELAKVSGKGVGMGDTNTDSRLLREKKKKKVRWSLSDEVEKVIEVGEAVGFDFDGVKEAAQEEIRRREQEDEARIHRR